jgi:beta-glucosidase
MKIKPISPRGLWITLAMLAGVARAADAPATAPASQASFVDPAVPAIPSATEAPTFLPMHEQFLKRAKEGNIDLLFLGDSIIDGWTKAPEVWEKNYKPLNAAHFGIGGDATQHLLWRISNGELDRIHPKVVVLLIGTNNSNSAPPESIAAAIEKIIGIVREKTGAKVLLLAIFPRDRKSVTNGPRMATIRAVNERLARLDDGKNVRYLDFSQKFMSSDGKLDPSLFPDGLHPNEKGYQIWADAMQGTLEGMMKRSE